MGFMRGLGIGLIIGAAYDYVNLIPIVGSAITPYRPFAYLIAGAIFFFIGHAKA